MLHLIWYIIVGLIAGVVAKSAMHMHMLFLWTIVLGIVGSIVGGLITHLIFRPREGASFHPAGTSRCGRKRAAGSRRSGRCPRS